MDSKGRVEVDTSQREELANKFVRVAAIGVEYTELADALRLIIDRESNDLARRTKRNGGSLAAADARISGLLAELQQLLEISVSKVQEQRRQHLGSSAAPAHDPPTRRR
ncbi:hypothetical protein [Burkholderia vietnamiensis]|uniref:hypothetical protein n=1 Tax=Burkholderia vietnamiensis TaxID=60552 RepID=UPI0012DA5BE7|nr:hypothetical protein [Burkholderia vietnamiensis]MCA8073814.1 hypothetical protein [Burkholderia vietnamiensis]